jgi:uncharacterized DUF497 family protein
MISGKIVYTKYIHMTVAELPEILEFEWDTGNEQKNWIRHNVKAEEAEEPFFTEERLVLEDRPHSTTHETRYILIGKSKKGRMLFIVYTIRKDKIRIISARDADRKEVSLYEKALELTKV